MTVTVTTRAGKGSPLTHEELDANFDDLATQVNSNTEDISLIGDTSGLQAQVDQIASDLDAAEVDIADHESRLPSVEAHSTQSSGNPHSVSKEDVGLGNVTNDAQLKRANGDILTFTEETTPVEEDVFLIEKADGTKKKAQLGNIPSTGGDSGGDSTNLLINPQFTVNQRFYTSGASLADGDYGFDRWKAEGGAATCTLSGDTLTIGGSNRLRQVVEAATIPAGTYTISWEGTCSVNIDNTGWESSPYTFTVAGGSDVTVDFNTGTLQQPMLVEGSYAAPFKARPITIERFLCFRYYFDYTNDQHHRLCLDSTGFGSTYYEGVSFPVIMRIPPTVTIVDTSESGSGFNGVGPGDIGVASVHEEGFRWNVDSTEIGGPSSIGIGYTADAEL